MRLNEQALLATQLEVHSNTYRTFMVVAATGNLMSLREAFQHVGREASSSTQSHWKREWIEKGILKKNTPKGTVALNDKFIIHDMPLTARTKLRRQIKEQLERIERELNQLKRLINQFE